MDPGNLIAVSDLAKHRWVVQLLQRGTPPLHPTVFAMAMEIERQRACVYLTIFPNPYPTKEHETYGIRRRHATFKHGVHYFLMKITDYLPSGGQDSDKFLSTATITITDAPTNPGKSLELVHLKDHITRSLTPGSNTEWRALCAADMGTAEELQGRLVKFLNEIKGTPEFEFDKVSDMIGTLVNGTRLTTQLAAGGTQARFEAASEPESVVAVLPEAYGGSTQGQKLRWVSIVVQPRIDAGNDQTWGFTMIDPSETGLAYHRFRVLIQPSSTTWATAEDLVAAQYSNLCPDISYNAMPLDPTWVDDQRVVNAASLLREATIMEFFEGLHLQHLSSSKLTLRDMLVDPQSELKRSSSGWLNIQIPYGDEERLAKLAEWVDEFHALKAHFEDPASTQEKGDERTPDHGILDSPLEEVCPLIVNQLTPRVAGLEFYRPTPWLQNASHVAFACKLSAGDGDSELSHFTNWIKIGPAPARSVDSKVREMPVIVLDGLGILTPTRRYVYHKKKIAGSGAIEGDREPYAQAAVIGPVTGDVEYRDV
ncbi:hypothetical protein FRC09_020324 [Ceratobasidium sp. 395]|nr:hypothetical protein FRC09_020324 [Ceratobasidium sp. 395]